VAYKNTNIDLIQNNTIINIPDIRDKQITGNKTINNIHLEGDYAYLACGFGIVVLDITKNEIKETYYIGPQGAALNVLDIASSPTELFACTDSGMKRASKTGVNLADFSNWSFFSNIPLARYNTATYFNNNLFVNLSGTDRDTTYYGSNDQWNYIDTEFPDKVVRLENSSDRLLFSRQYSTIEYSPELVRLRLVNDYYNGRSAFPSHAIVEPDGYMWIADRNHGLIKYGEDNSVLAVGLNGPTFTTSYNISAWDGRLYVASGAYTPTLSNQYRKTGYYTLKNNQWLNRSLNDFAETANLADYVRVFTDPFDSRRVYASAWSGGLVEYYDDQFVAFYDASNSTLSPVAGTSNILRVSGMAMDNNRTLWIGGTESEFLLYAKTNAGAWHGFNLGISGSIHIKEVVIDNFGQKWATIPRTPGGLIVFSENGTLGNASDDKVKRLTQSAGNGNLAGSLTTAIAVDLNGQVWVGTDNGISVFFSPQNVFSGNNFDAQRILVQQDGYVQYLLENEYVTSIQVDGANRKWIGTQGAGVFLMSADGTEEILRFTTANSPLFSNNITSIGIDQLSGEVFFGTEKGLISYRGTATYGPPEFDAEQVYAYPNPVRHDYNGYIAIKGLVRDADVKITDAQGRTVYATKADGGQAIWDGRSHAGDRATTGVYLVFASDQDGNETFVTKILFIQ